MYQWIKVKARKKACETFFYDEIKERRETGGGGKRGEWLIGAHTENIGTLSFN